MAYPTSRSFPVQGFMGLNERHIVGSDPRETSFLNNVIVRNGIVTGRKGIDEFDTITTVDTDTPILGHFAHYTPSTGATSLLRMTPTKMRKWNSVTHVWDDITGTALTGAATTQPCFYTMSDEGYSVFTNGGEDQPRKYTGSGNTATLGGDPPYAKWLCPFYGFLFLFNTSLNGTFAEAADPITSYFSDQPDTSWDLCDGNAIVFDESSGELVAAEVFGDSLVVFKRDAIVQVRWAGGLVRFHRRKLNFNLGLLAPRSLQRLGETGLIFLATDRNLYITDGQQVRALPRNVQKSLQETMSVAKAPFSHAMVDADKETYHLFYQKDGSTYFDGVLSFNYSTGEFYRSEYPVEFNSSLGFRLSPTTAWRMIGSSSNLTYEFNTTTTDNGTRIERVFDLDWHRYGVQGNKWLKGAELVFKRAAGTRARISVAVDKSSAFEFPQIHSLKGTDPDETEVRVSYQLPTPTYGSWFKFRVELLHDLSSTVAELLEIEPEFIPVHPIVADNPPKPVTNFAS